MTKKTSKKKHPHHKAKRRNAASPVATTSAPRPRRRAIRRGPTPDLAQTFASVAGGGGGAVLGGILANQEILSPETVGLAMTIGGAVGAYTLDGNARIAANGVAAAGAGQLALALMEKRATAKPKDRDKDKANGLDDAPPPRQGRRVLSNFQTMAPEVATRLGFVDADYDGYDD